MRFRVKHAQAVSDYDDDRDYSYIASNSFPCRWTASHGESKVYMSFHPSQRLTIQLPLYGLLLTASFLWLTGCGAFSPQRRTDAFGPTTAKTPGLTQNITSTTKGIGGQFKSMGAAVSSAFSKTKSVVSNTFSPGSSSSDPTSLNNVPSPTSLGPEIWVTNGQLYENQGQYAKALDNYSKALELEPNNESALLSTAHLYSRQKQHAQASEFFAKAVAVAPKAGTYNDFAWELNLQGKHVEAQATQRKAIEMDPSNIKFRNNLASMLVGTGRSDEAVQELQSVFSAGQANYNVALLNYQNKNLAAAQQHLTVALQQEPALEPAKKLMQQLSGSASAQAAVAAYKDAGELYRTAQAVVTPQTHANQAIYQKPSPGASTSAIPSSGPRLAMPPSQNLPGGSTSYPSSSYSNEPINYPLPAASSSAPPTQGFDNSGYNQTGYSGQSGSPSASRPTLNLPVGYRTSGTTSGMSNGAGLPNNTSSRSLTPTNTAAGAGAAYPSLPSVGVPSSHPGSAGARPAMNLPAPSGLPNAY
ncbi:MAG: tetratricopeptide repeat protein [Planctomycetota bacterium]